MNKLSTTSSLDLVIVLTSSILLGIWAVKDTIALRNILLVVGTLLSICYIVREWRHGDLKKHCTIWKSLPILLSALTFFWVVSHYLFFSVDQVKQFEELSSTWLRSFMAFIVGLATGHILRNHPKRLSLLWIGIFIAFLVLSYQYIPRALAQNKLHVPDYDYYLFHLKINTVLVGMILIAGIDGALLDHLRSIHYRWSNLRLWYLLYWLLGNGLVLWAFVYVVDARNGIGLSAILYGFWFLCSLIFFIRSQMHYPNIKSALPLLITGIGVCIIFSFTLLQMKVNNGWHTLFDDVILAIQIDRYPHWQDSAQMGYPKHENGSTVTPNTYERVAWATAGSRAIIAYPKGVGILAHPFAKHPSASQKTVTAPNPLRIATHSGWVELGLAFGIPILSLIFSALLLIFIEAFRHEHPARMTILSFVVLIFCLYAVGEVTVQHGVEILYFLLAFISLLTFTEQKILDDDQISKLS